MKLQRTALRTLSRLEDGWDALRARVFTKGPEQIEIVCFAGYRNHARAHLKGRVIAARQPIRPGAGTLSRIRGMLRTYQSHEVPGVEIEVALHGRRHALVTDNEGYFELDFDDDRALPDVPAWEMATVKAPGTPTVERTYELPVLAPATDSRYGIISDIDDTVIETGVNNFLKNWRRVLVEQPEERLVVPGAVPLYRALAGRGKAPAVPLFYVSSSPWNLYPFLHKFMAHNGLPFGPCMLKDWGITEEKLIGGSHVKHKVAAVERVVSFFPTLKFFLIGDNSQKDVTVYAQVVEDYPDNVAGVFIRDVRGTCGTGREREGLQQIRDRGVPTFCGPSLDGAIDVAREAGLDLQVA